MKRVYLVFSFLASIGFSYGQVATINQTNIKPDNSVVEATVSQSGSHTASVTQVNDKVLGNASYTNELTANVDQQGTSGNSVTISQSATGVGKKNNELTVNTTQNGTNNTALQTQTSDGYTARFMNFNVIQKHDGNYVEQISTKGNTNFRVRQNGSNSTALQYANVGEGKNNTGVIKQVNNNYARQNFEGKNARKGYINQNGSYNQATQLFTGGGYGAGNKSQADIYQNGDNGIAHQSQDGKGSYQYVLQAAGSEGNVAYQSAVGDNNSAYIYQYGTGATANILQTGDDNFAGVDQDGVGSYADIDQTGDWNVVQGIGSANAINNNGSSLTVIQTGNENVVNSVQTAVGAEETVTQSGIGNIATVNQY